VKPVEVRFFSDREEMSEAAAGEVLVRIGENVRRAGRCTLVLAGGSTPRPLYRLLSEEPFRSAVPWGKVHLFWGDERCVPPDHPDSNQRMGREELIDRVPVPPENVHPIPIMSGPGEAAAAYEEELTRFFGLPVGGLPPSFDLVILGVGADGHAASLFPGSGALSETARWVVPAEAPPGSPVPRRVTMTLPLFDRAERILVLVAGPGKSGVVELLQRDPEEAARRYPAARVRGRESTLWLVAEDG
jgi:6-phosphogluconolactonase